MLILREVPRSGVRLSAGLTAAETTAALALAHTAAGGMLPSAGWLMAIAATVYGASLLVLRGRLPVRVVLPALVGSQVLLHAWLVTLTSGTGMHPHGPGSDAAARPDLADAARPRGGRAGRGHSVGAAATRGRRTARLVGRADP